MLAIARYGNVFGHHLPSRNSLLLCWLDSSGAAAKLSMRTVMARVCACKTISGAKVATNWKWRPPTHCHRCFCSAQRERRPWFGIRCNEISRWIVGTRIRRILTLVPRTNDHHPTEDTHSHTRSRPCLAPNTSTATCVVCMCAVKSNEKYSKRKNTKEMKTWNHFVVLCCCCWLINYLWKKHLPWH